MNRKSCDHKLSNTGQDGDQVLGVCSDVKENAVCNSLMLLYSQNRKNNLEVMKFSFSRKVSKTKGEEKQHKGKRLKSKKNTRG